MVEGPKFDGVVISTGRFILPYISEGDVDVDNIFTTEGFHSDFFTERLTGSQIVIEVMCTYFILSMQFSCYFS